MFFSICIPVYNTSLYLEECIESVLKQSEIDYEVILLNDGSTDNSPEICDRYAQKYPNIRAIHKENEGLMMTRRRGFMEAKGEYVLCLDSDDYYCRDDVLEQVKQLIISEKCDLVMFSYIVGRKNTADDMKIDVLDLPNGYVFDANDKDRLYKNFLLGKWVNNIWARAVRRDLIDTDIDYSIWKEDICRGEDRFQSFPVFNNASRIGYLSDGMVYYRWTESSISNNPKLKFYNAFRTIYKREDLYMDIWQIDDETRYTVKLRRIPNMLGIISEGYYLAKTPMQLKEWKHFFVEISNDSFFEQLYSDISKEKILLYYRFLGNLISNGKINIYILVLKFYKWYSKNIRHRKG